MSAVRLLFHFLKTYRSWQAVISVNLIWRIRSVSYVLVLLYSFVLMKSFPSLQDIQPLRLQEFISQEAIRTVLWLTVVLWPLMEELLFRAGMKWWGRNVSWLWAALLFVLMKIFFSWRFEHLIVNDLRRSLASYGFFVFCAVLSFWILKPRFPRISRAYALWSAWIFWVLTLGFGLVHLGNFDLGNWNWMMLLLVVPQIILWIMLGFVRMQRWLGRSIYLHMFHNLIQIIPLLLLKYFGGIDLEMQITNFTHINQDSAWIVYAWLYFVLLFWFVCYHIIKEIVALSDAKS